MTDNLFQFCAAIKATGLEPPENIVPGKIYRFPGIGKTKENKAGWCLLFLDQLGGCYGDWSTGLSEIWQGKSNQKLTPDEKAQFKHQIQEAQLKALNEVAAIHQEGAKRALSIWDNSKPAEANYPYLVSKNIEPKGIRCYKGSLVIPLRADGKIYSLQFIDPDGNKQFLSGGRVAGCYFSLGNPLGADVICIVEGVATGKTINMATGYPVAVAFSSSNLLAIAQVMSEQFPEHTLIICADDDADKKGNPGLTKANQVADIIGAKVAIPYFGIERPIKASDFNDMAALRGLSAVAETIKAVVLQSDDKNWPAPLPLFEDISAVPYPLDALPDGMRHAVEEVATFTKAPIPLVASSAMAALSLAVQSYVDVKRAEGLTGPVSLFLLTVADSGERKSTCDGFFTQSIRNYESSVKEKSKPLIKDYQAEIAIWEEKYRGVKEQIRTLAKANKSTYEEELRVASLEHEKPVSPLIPRLVYCDITPEALKWTLAKVWPSGGILSSEAGTVLGSHGMAKESVMRNLATFNQLWDGSSIPTERRGSESFTVTGARLTVGLQVQEVALRHFLNHTNGLARGTGFLARFLIAYPESTQGHRFFTEPPESWLHLAKFNMRISEILNQEVTIDKNGGLSVLLLSLSPEAKKAWICFHDVIEGELGVGGELSEISDVASKIADNAARVAALFKVFNQGVTGTIGFNEFENASRIVAWHLHEAKRFFAGLVLSDDQTDVVKLDSWLVRYCLKKKTNIVSRRDVQRNIVPIRLREKKALDIVLNVLVEAKRIRQIQSGKKKGIYINPALLVGGTNDH
ncbi:TPA: DUF3987 domain-containing protein [Legionella pneumophila]|nr:DUF3987 domain-containing protein [Legionella pneumophila]HAU1874384.1 DUF3987 domain-containing protein [Legionella pneumophila]HBD7079383.1 DUF3987 domain-containing protein [Legionella pneumophila]HCC0692337.1 DUF3987 domain-containing protein [Legionella pneumophila]